MGVVRTIVTTFPFTLLGIVSHVALILAADGTIPTTGIWNLLIVPAYGALLLLFIAGRQLFPDGLPAWFSVASLPLLLLPFLLLDFLLYLLRGWWSRMERAHA